MDAKGDSDLASVQLVGWVALKMGCRIMIVALSLHQMVVPLNHRKEKDKGNQDRSWAIKFEALKQVAPTHSIRGANKRPSFQDSERSFEVSMGRSDGKCLGTR